MAASLTRPMWMRQFDFGAWRRAYRRRVRHAFERVPFYRDQWAEAGRPLDEPVPTPVGALPDPPFSLCPLGADWRPCREPSLWILTAGAGQ